MPDEPRLNPAICLEATGGPAFNNVTIRRESGVRRTNEEWEQALRTWKINFVVRWRAKDSTGAPDLTNPSYLKFLEVKAFWLARRGNSRSFRFKDWTDYTDEGAGRVALIDGVYRLVKDYTDGVETYTTLIYKPVADTIVISGVTGSGLALDPATGIVANATGPGTWTGEYDLWCHFVEPEFQAQALPSGILKWSGITVMEDVVPDD